MSADKLLEYLDGLDQLGLRYWLDGGWGVDSLLGKETREHKDADLIIEKKDLDAVKAYFASKGFEDKTEGDMWWHFFMTSPDTEVDFLVLDFQPDGSAYYGPIENGAIFPADVFATGGGEIKGRKVNTLTAAYRVKCLTKEFGVVTRNGYEINDKDAIDMVRLCKHYNLPIPEDYTERLTKSGIALDSID